MPNLWKMISETTQNGVTTTTSALDFPGIGAIIQVTNKSNNHDGTTSMSTALTFAPFIAVIEELAPSGELAARRLIVATPEID